MIRRAALLGLMTAALAVPAVAAPIPNEAAEKAAILKVIADMEAAWNRGDFQGYMAGFQNPGVVFVSKGRFQDGWQGTLDHYVRDYGGAPETRGKLRFFDIRIEMLAPRRRPAHQPLRAGQARPAPGRDQHPLDAQGRRPLGDRAEPRLLALTLS